MFYPKLIYTDDSKYSVTLIEDYLFNNGVFKSKSEVRKLKDGEGLYINREKVSKDKKYILTFTDDVYWEDAKSFIPMYLLSESELSEFKTSL